MKIALISDIHGNSWALQAVLDDIKTRTVDTIYDLGDSLYGPLDPAGAFKLLTEHNINSIRGNQDRMIIENQDNNTDNATLAFVISQLDKPTMTWLINLPVTRQIGNMILCHGTPHQDDVYLLEEVLPDNVIIKEGSILDNELSETNERIVCCGHSHIANMVQTENKIIVNPGSIGLPAYDDDLPYYHQMENYHSHARYCILEADVNNIKIDQISVPYDFEKAAQKAEMNNRYDWAFWLRTGRCKKKDI